MRTFLYLLLSAIALPGAVPTDTHRLSLPAQHLDVEFTPSQVQFHHSETEFSIRLAAYGRPHELQIPSEVRPNSTAKRIEYRRPGLTEWYVHDAAGLEQGFTLTDRPNGAGPVELSLDIAGDLRPNLSNDTIFLGKGSQQFLSYSQLKAWDARGRTLPARLAVDGQRITITVDDHRAAYPITIDPLFQDFQLLPLDPTQALDFFGYSVAVSGDTAVVSRPGLTVTGGASAAYVFLRNGSAWIQQAKLVPPSGTMGDAVAINGDTLVVTSTNTGSAYVFTRTGTLWTQQATLTPSDTASRFGTSVSLSGDTILVGTFNQSPPAVYVFVRNGSTWTQQAKLVTPGSIDDQFGYSLSVSGDTALIGAPGGEPASAPGGAYVFVRSGTTWTQQTLLTASDGFTNDQFGRSLSLSGDTALIGAPSAAGVTAGAAYVYVRNGSVWTETKLTPPQGDRFGRAVSISGDAAAIAGRLPGPQGVVFAYARSAGVWTQQDAFSKKVQPGNVNIPDFGTALAVNGDTIIVGAGGFPNSFNTFGLAYAFSRSVVNIRSNPSGRTFTVSGPGCGPSGPFTTPGSFNWPLGSVCSVAFTSPDNSADARYTFQQWDDASTLNPRSFTAPAVTVSYTAQFAAEYRLNTLANPPVGGTVIGSGFYPAGTNATVDVAPSPGFVFFGFSGAISASTAPQVVLMDAPKTVTADFQPAPPAALSASITSKQGASSGRLWNLTLMNNGPGIAYGAQINGVMLTQTFGAACAPIRLSPPAFPIVLGSLAAGGSGTGTLLFDFSSCPANARFTATAIFSANGGSSVGLTNLVNQFQ